MTTTPTDLPDLAHRRPTLVAVPPQASRVMTEADVIGAAVDRILDAARATTAVVEQRQQWTRDVVDAAVYAVECRERIGHWQIEDLEALAAAVGGGR